MSKRLIDANELISAMYYYEHNEGRLTAYDAQDIINKAPTIDVVPKDFHDKTCEAMAERHTEEIQRYMWIPCSERLPEERLIVLVSFEEIYGLPSIGITYYNKGKWEDALYREVVAWMPLPKPYREGE